MRRAILMLSVLGLLALGLGLGVPLAGASSGDQESPVGPGECRGDVVVQLNARLWDRPGHDTFVVDLSEPLGPGTWSVNAESFDEYKGRKYAEQDHEQWMLQLRVGPIVVATLGPTTDIPDGTDAGSSSDQLGTVTLSQEVDNLRLVHYDDDDDDDPGSVTASCVGFELVSPPTTTTTTPSTTTTTTTSLKPPASSTTTTSLKPPPSSSAPSEPNRPSTSSPPSRPPTTTEPETTTLPVLTPTPTPAPTDSGQGSGGIEEPGVSAAEQAGVQNRRSLGAIAQLRTSVDCSSRTVTAVVSNVGDQPTSVDVFLVTEAARTGIDLPAGSSTRVDFALPASSEGRLLDLVVADDIGVADTGQILVDCQRPAEIVATVVVDCPADSLSVVLENTGQEANGVDVIIERSGLVTSLELKGGESRTVTVALDGRSEVPLRIVDSDGSDVLRKLVVVDCPRPLIESTSSVSCISGEVLVTVWNTGDATGLVDVTTDAEAVRDVAIQPGSVVVIGLPFGSDSILVPLRISEVGGPQISSTDLPVSCNQAPPDTSVPCASVSVVEGSQAGTTIVSTPVPGEPWWVEAGSLPDGLLSTQAINASRSCAVPSAVFSVDCSSGTLGVRLSNAGSIGTRIAVILGGRAQGPGFDIGPGGSSTLSFAISDFNQVTLIEAGRVEPLTSFDLGCGSDGGVAKTVSYAVFSVTVLGTLLAMAFDPRKWLLIFK